MAFLSEQMKAQLMKVVGVGKDEFNSLLAQHVPDISQCKDALGNSSPFDVHLVLFRNLLDEQGEEKLKNLTTVPDKLSYIYKILYQSSDFQDIKSILPDPKSMKDAEESKSSKDKGNLQFQKKNFDEAIGLYNRAIQTADPDSKDLSLCLGNRSVVFYNMKQYKNCIQDCKAALEFGYPEDLRYKILERQGRCYKEIGQNQLSRTSFMEAINLLTKSKLSEDKRKIVREEIEDILSKLSENDEEESDAVNRMDHLKLASSHPQFPCLSSSVEMRYNSKVGRHTVAVKKIRPGEVIIKEKPLAWTLNRENTLNTCCGCLAKAKNHMLPSKLNENTVYCSLDCYNRSLNSQENLPTACKGVEFRISDLFSTKLDTSATTLLSLWAVKSQPLQFFTENEKSLFQDSRPDFGVKEETSWKLEGKEQLYKSLYNLVSHMDTLSEEAEINMLITTAVLIRLLQDSGYFPEPSSNGELSAAERLIGRLLFQFQCGIKFNQHGVYNTEKEVEVGKNLPLIDSGIGVYPTLLFMNHSCCPNTFRINDGITMIVVAKTEIQPGEEVTDCYGIHHLSIEKAQRRDKLSRGFKFDCACKACDKNWPLFPGLESNLTQSEMGRLGNHLSTYQKEHRAKRFPEALSQCQTYLEKLSQINIEQPHRNYEIGGLALTSCFWGSLQHWNEC